MEAKRAEGERGDREEESDAENRDEKTMGKDGVERSGRRSPQAARGADRDGEEEKQREPRRGGEGSDGAAETIGGGERARQRVLIVAGEPDLREHLRHVDRELVGWRVLAGVVARAAVVA